MMQSLEQLVIALHVGAAFELSASGHPKRLPLESQLHSVKDADPALLECHSRTRRTGSSNA